MPEPEALSQVEIVPYDPNWPDIYAAERAELVKLAGAALLELEHIGSTAIPGLPAKPIVDMMAAASDLAEAQRLAPIFGARGYQVIETGMQHRLLLRRREQGNGQVFHLHIVERSAWDDRKERLMRDYLLAHPEARTAYGALKAKLAADHAGASLAYTVAKTPFIQNLIDNARAELGLPPIDVWID
jgi:GrpB-like predicted nucleotidyltransferase (UPF0157 family)